MACEDDADVPRPEPAEHPDAAGLRDDLRRTLNRPEPAVESLEERFWVIERRRTRPDGTTGPWRFEYCDHGTSPPDDPSTEYFERRVTEYVPAALLSQVAAEARAGALEDPPVCEVCGEAQDGRVWGDVEVCRGCYEGARHSLQVDHEKARADQAEAALAEARAVLREVEWAVETTVVGGQPDLACPSCGRNRLQGHAPDCRLAKVLG